MANCSIIAQYICIQYVFENINARPARHIKRYSIFDIMLGPCLQSNKMSFFLYFLFSSMWGSANY